MQCNAFHVCVCVCVRVCVPRDNNTLQQANRKLERKMREMKMQVDEENVSLQNQRDQVSHVRVAFNHQPSPLSLLDAFR